MIVMTGSCDCGNLTLRLFTTLSPEQVTPRACDCSFCLKHGAMYVSDSSGRLRIDVRKEEYLGKYRQGSRTAEFLFCKRCAVLVAVVAEREGTMSGAVNARCMDDFDGFGEPEVVSPRKLTKEEKMARWDAAWIKDVAIKVD